MKKIIKKYKKHRIFLSVSLLAVTIFEVLYFFYAEGLNLCKEVNFLFAVNKQWVYYTHYCQSALIIWSLWNNLHFTYQSLFICDFVWTLMKSWTLCMPWQCNYQHFIFFLYHSLINTYSHTPSDETLKVIKDYVFNSFTQSKYLSSKKIKYI